MNPAGESPVPLQDMDFREGLGDSKVEVDYSE